MGSFFTFSGRDFTNVLKMATARKIFENIKNPTIYGRLIKGNITVACGMVVIERGYAALMNVAVDTPHQNKGCGREICESLLVAAKSSGAHTSYLEVVQGNHKALNLYEKLGYKKVFSYQNRIKAKEN